MAGTIREKKTYPNFESILLAAVRGYKLGKV
jgi:hypothetical protein